MDIEARVKLPPTDTPNRNGKVYPRDVVLKACEEKGITVHDDEMQVKVPAGALGQTHTITSVKFSKDFGHISHRNNTIILDNVLADFLAKDEQQRVVTLGFPKPTDPYMPDTEEELLHKAGVGTISTIKNVGGEYIASVTIDPKMPCGDTLLKILSSNIKFGFAFGGFGEQVGDDQYQFTEITSVALLPE